MSDLDGPRKPTRPLVPSVFYLMVSTFVASSVWLRWDTAWEVACGHASASALVMPLLVVTLGLAAALLAIGLRAPPVARVVGIVAAGLLAGSIASCVALWRGAGIAGTLSAAPVSSVRVVVDGEPTKSRYGYRMRASLVSETGTTGQVWVSAEQPLELGTVYTCVGRFESDEGEWGVTSRAQGVWGTVRVRHVISSEPLSGLPGELARISSGAYESFEPSGSDARALAAACVTGRRAALKERGLDKVVSACGVSHLVAVSGTHISVVLSLVGMFLGKTRISRLPRFMLLLSVGGCFVVFCGAPASGVRALVMTMCALCSDLIGRRSQALAGLSVSALAMMLFDPCVTGQLGFCLSVVCVGALTTFSPYVGYLLEVALPHRQEGVPSRVPRKVRRRVAKLAKETKRVLCASLSAQVATVPITAPSFGTLSLVGPFANLVVSVPFVALVHVGLMACLAMWAPPLHQVALVAVDAVGIPLAWGLHMLSALPMASIPVEVDALPLALCLAVLSVALLIAWPAVRPASVRMCGCLVIAVALVGLCRWRLLAPAGIHVLDIGQGDAILVRDGSAAILVDAGPDDAIRSALARNHVYHLDAVVVTHLHDDHYGGLGEIAGTIPVDEVYVAHGVTRSDMGQAGECIRAACGHDPTELAYGDTLRVGGFDLTVVWPIGDVKGDVNADSIMMDVEYHVAGGDMRALLTGDAERDECDKIAGAVGDIDFLKVGHHGSEVSITPDEAAVLAPEVAIASAGEGNKYGHPKDECIDILKRSGAAFLCTKDVGDVCVCPGEGGVVVSTSRDPPVL